MPEISYNDFLKLDIRVAKILEVEKIPGKSRILKGIIDLGSKKCDVIIGGAEFFEPDENDDILNYYKVTYKWNYQNINIIKYVFTKQFLKENHTRLEQTKMIFFNYYSLRKNYF